MSSLFPFTPTTEGASRYCNSSVAGGVSGISTESVVFLEDCEVVSGPRRPAALSLVAVLLKEDGAAIFVLVVSQISSRSTGRHLKALLFSPPLQTGWSASTVMLGGSEPRFTEQVRRFGDNVLLNVGVTEETALGIGVISGLDCCVARLGCGGVIVKADAGAIGVRAVLGSEARDGGTERIELYES